VRVDASLGSAPKKPKTEAGGDDGGLTNEMCVRSFVRSLVDRSENAVVLSRDVCDEWYGGSGDRGGEGRKERR